MTSHLASISRVCARLGLGLALTASTVAAADPLLDSWQTSSSRRYARVWQTTADRTAGAASTTWPRSGLRSMGGGQSAAAYSGVQRIVYSPSCVYVSATGLSSHMMGPWYLDAAKSQIFGNWPTNGRLLWRFPRMPSVAATKTATRLGPIALGVNGVAIFNGLDALSYASAQRADSMNGDKIWNRDALVNESVTFDPALAHQPPSGQYHYHVNPIALRFQLADHVSYDANTGAYAEATTAPAHLPILGWSPDGYPIYGPYGYSDPTSATSGARRMTSGFAKRDGTNGTTNLAVTGRTALPKWAADVQGRSQTLSSSQSGPAVAGNYVLGYYQEDYDYLGDLGKTPGTDFDLDRCNGRFCVTPEFPAGTYAYFVTIDASGSPAWPYIIGPQYYGNASGGAVTAINETVTDYLRAGQAATIKLTATNANGAVTLAWESVEGGTYKIETSSDNATWSALASAVTSEGGERTSYATTTIANYYRVTLTALASYDTGGTGGVSGLGNNATASSAAVASGSDPAPAVGTSGTARLVNLATRAQSGGAAGTPIVGFTLRGTSAKKMLVRAIGPALATLGVGGALADPSLALMSGAATVASNDNWNASDAATFAATGAFALAGGSKDAAIVATLAPGGYTAPIGSGGGSGVVLLEAYEADAASGTTLVNASRGAFVGTGEQVLIPGFVIAGSGAAKLLIRAVGPTLATYGVTGVLADPQIALFSPASGATAMATNDNWSSAGNAAEIAGAAAQAGAFALASGTKDAALLVTLGAGGYTATVSGVGGTTGTALVEIYLVP